MPSGRLYWTGGIRLTWRILAVNIIALALLAGGFSYIDSYRTRILDTQLAEAQLRINILADGYRRSAASTQAQLLLDFARRTNTRVRVYGSKGAMTFDSFAAGGPRFDLVNPHEEQFKRKLARSLDKAIDEIVGAAPLPPYQDPRPDRAGSWPEIGMASPGGASVAMARYAPDRTPMITTATRLPDGTALLASENARDITRIVRAERLSLGIVLGSAILVSTLLSLFLARTIVLPLQRLASAAVRVRLGRARQVTVPRLPERRDEIGMLARAISDMTQALRHRIDATDAFAADVSHELKNPIASLRSALDALESVQQPDLRAQLMALAHDDVRRLDRLVTDIAEASRIDAQLSHTRFEAIDLGQMIERMIFARETRGVPNQVRVAFARPRKDVAVVMGEPQRLALVIDNLLDNAVSFSPAGGLVQVTATVADNQVMISVEDEGPGVPPQERETVFRRFHSVRPEGESFGKHSGLGLAIARSVVEGHQGRIAIADRDDAQAGARFVVRLPLADLGDPGIASE
ncbi:MAG: stimulus-sensing domain-containing protein [Sphingobium sp.]